MIGGSVALGVLDGRGVRVGFGVKVREGCGLAVGWLTVVGDGGKSVVSRGVIEL